MRAASVLLISTIAHVPLVVYIARLAMRPPPYPTRLSPSFVRRTPDATAMAASTPRAAAEPIEVVFLHADERSTATTPVAPDSELGNAGSRSMARTSPPSPLRDPGASAALPPSSAAPKPTIAGAGSFLRMRDIGLESGAAAGTTTGGPDLALAPSTADRIAASRTGPPPDELRKSGRLERTPGGGAIVHDRVTTMTVEPDGSITFNDAKDIDLRFRLPIPKIWLIEEMRKELGHELTKWYEDPEAGKRYGTTSDLPRHLQASPGACDTWSAAFCDDPLAPQTEERVRERKNVNAPLYGGAADITAWLHRKLIGDPYASRKLKLLSDTLDERVAMGNAHRAEQRARSAELMRRNLEQLWEREKRPVARRAALFELWDECSEDEDGMRARAMVIGWIRSRLPAGSPDAYTAQEIDVLQTRRTSAMRFEPYPDNK